MKNLLVIGHTFPEPSTTAAGMRMMQLLQLFQNNTFRITFASTATKSGKSADLEKLGISTSEIRLNDSSFDEFVKKLNPEVVVFDRFLTEEQFGWRVAENCPNALRILDTEDLHFLRKAREEAIRKGKPVQKANLYSALAKREVASIFRSDLSLIISEFEMELLQKQFQVPAEILCYLPFLLKDFPDINQITLYENRSNFFTIGNLLHAPNVDSVLQLKKIWREIRKKMPRTELHIYGAYAPQQVLELHCEKEGFIIKGWAENVEEVMKQYRLQLAPIRFGAGLKGKIIDGMRFGVPSITTEIGAEGIGNIEGLIAKTEEDFIEKTIQLYTDKKLWKAAQLSGFEIVENKFPLELFAEDFLKLIEQILLHLEKHREKNFFGQILQHHSLQSTKYLSKWIESKNSVRKNFSPVCYAESDEIRPEYK